ncbi:MAG: xanthine dehydrogenase family protein subunit M [Thermodesulfobacteriota bacterium]
MRFNYLEPRTVEEAVRLLIQYQGTAKVIAGGTDLLNQIRMKMVKPEYILDISYIPGLDYIKYNGDGRLSIGALTTIRSLERSAEIREHHPVISEAASLIGSMAIRNVGTIGGNLCHASPSAETAPSLIGLGARVKLTGPHGERMVALERFFTGPGQTVLQTGELMAEIEVPALPPKTRGLYLKHTTRGTVNPAIVGVASIVTMDGKRCKEIKLVLGAVAPTPIRAKKAEEILRGKEIDDLLIEKAARAASEESSPISDVRASADYRKEMVKVFTRYAVRDGITR